MVVRSSDESSSTIEEDERAGMWSSDDVRRFVKEFRGWSSEDQRRFYRQLVARLRERGITPDGTVRAAQSS